MDLQEKYKSLIGPGMQVEKEEENKWNILFTDFQKMFDFLLIYNKNDFAGIRLEVSTAGNCQLCGMMFMGSCSEELLELNAIKAREVKVKGGELIVHACPLCQIREVGGLQNLIDQTKAGIKMHGLTPVTAGSQDDDQDDDEEDPNGPRLH